MAGVIGGIVGGTTAAVYPSVAPKSARVGSSSPTADLAAHAGRAAARARAGQRSQQRQQQIKLQQQTAQGDHAGRGEQVQERPQSGPGAQKSPSGNVVFRSEETMEVGRTYPVFVMVSPSADQAALTNLLRNRIANAESSSERAAPDSGKITAETVPVSARMRAHLTANADELQISPVTSEDQDTTFESVTTWQWMVKPLKSGKDLKLDLTVSVLLDESGTPHAVDTYHRFIKVEVPLLAMISRINWQWMLSTLLIPTGAWLWKRKRTSPDQKSS